MVISNEALSLPLSLILMISLQLDLNLLPKVLVKFVLKAKTTSCNRATSSNSVSTSRYESSGPGMQDVGQFPVVPAAGAAKAFEGQVSHHWRHVIDLKPTAFVTILPAFHPFWR